MKKHWTVEDILKLQEAVDNSENELDECIEAINNKYNIIYERGFNEGYMKAINDVLEKLNYMKHNKESE